MGLEQLIWIVILLVILLISVIKRIIGQKGGKRLDRVNLSESAVKKEIRARPATADERETEWERFLSDMLGLEMPPVHKTKEELKEKPVPDSKQVTEKEIDKPVRIEQKSPLVPEIEKRRLKPAIEERIEKHQLKPTIEECYAKLEDKWVKREKERAVTPFNLFKKVGLKDAIIYSEIIGPPLTKRKHHRIF